MSKNSLFTAIDKHVSVDEWIQFINKNPECAQYLAVSSGITEQDSINLNNVLQAVPQINYICLDVANGYTEHFVQVVKNTRSKYPTKTIIVISFYSLFISILNIFSIAFSDGIWPLSTILGNCESRYLDRPLKIYSSFKLITKSLKSELDLFE